MVCSVGGLTPHQVTRIPDTMWYWPPTYVLMVRTSIHSRGSSPRPKLLVCVQKALLYQFRHLKFKLGANLDSFGIT